MNTLAAEHHLGEIEARSVFGHTLVWECTLDFEQVTTGAVVQHQELEVIRLEKGVRVEHERMASSQLQQLPLALDVVFLSAGCYVRLADHLHRV